MAKHHLIALLIVAGSVFSQELGGRSGDYSFEKERTFELGAGGQLQIKNIRADVEICSWDKDVIRIIETMNLSVRTKEEATQIIQAIDQSYTLSGNTLRITGEESSGIKSHSLQITTPNRFNLDLHVSGGDVEIESVDGKINVNTFGGDILLSSLSGNISANTAGGDIEVNTISGECRLQSAGGDLRLHKIYGETSANTAGGNIELTDATAPVALNTAGGNISVLETKEAVSAKTQGGNIDVQRSQGECRLATMGGDVVLIDVSGRADVTSHGGEISGKKLAGPLNVQTMGGEIDLDEVQGPLNAKSFAGDIKVRFTLTDFSKSHAMNLETLNGDIDLTLPKTMPATISAEIRMFAKGRLPSRHNIYSDFPLTTAQPEKWGQSVLRSTGEINNGGDPIVLITSAGDISLKAE
ncbi:MAG TPA: hypothetical protein PKN04_10890 [bacterium]|nr:hypothetical protein [bacterium]HNT66275.1 hypothetical protein [bacterium]HOX86811.1 hypothetical protein [bacterium]HPG46966.1 hypothetical protein [bacterium]HPM99266.1 hypothetical protein [bacterium]